eukprot:CAMPEP_0182437040 /NCGR_PEP_ID=MMETSP1167-20130531/84774_1 /TAXON_ID=2988 /ORGANISM="Mallomonas Sp, Strain CCMP3275" /LENGTH=244 /DNA_ID=CAMNT_0024629813 /DNA_START=107 /DNA_END=839 /DNA_ORIENTATION=-
MATSSAVKMGFESEIGAQPPLGFWDPLGLLAEADQERFDRLRYVETKHGRIAMLAILGHLVTSAGIRLPGEIAYGLPFADMKTGLAAFETIPAAGIAQTVAFIGLIELGFQARQEEIEEAQLKASSAVKMGFESEIGAQPPLGFWDPLGLLAEADQERFDRLRYVETKHGRIAMLAILGHLVTSAGIRLPGEIAYGLPFADMKTGLAAFETIPAAGIAQTVAFIGLIELGFQARQEEIEEAQLK